MSSIIQIIWGIIGFVPGIIWLAIFLRRDRQKPEPAQMIGKAFLYGMLITPVAALAEELLFPALFINAIIISAPVEEYFKYKIFKWKIAKNKSNDEPIDSMIYMITIALGFASIENIILAITTSINNTGPFSLLLSRFLSATLIHALCSGVIGYFIAKARFGKRKLKVIHGLGFAILAHGIYNYIAWKSNTANTIILDYALLALLISMFVIVSMQFKNLKTIKY